MHPAAWILWVACAGLVVTTTTNPWYLLPLIAVAYFVYATQYRPGPTARSFRLFLLFALMTITIRTALVLFDQSLTINNVVFAMLEGLKLGTLLIVFGTFNSVTDPYGVLRLSPRRFHEPALAAALALSIAPRTMEAVGKVREAQRLRGMKIARWRTLPALAVPVLENGMEDATTLAESMDARGHGRGARTRYRPQPWTAHGIATAVTAVAAATLFVVAWLGDLTDTLSPITDPLSIPAASPLLVAAVALLAVPGFFPREEDA